MRLWVTRAEPGAARTADRLTALGHAPLVAPLLRTEPLPVARPDLTGVGALAFTSATGVVAFAALGAARGLPVFTVGDATARAAREAGWSDVRSADGDGAALARLIAAARERLTGSVLAPGAREPAFDLPAALAEDGIAARTLAVYATTAINAVPPTARAALLEGELDGLLLHSPAAARALAALAAVDAGLADALTPLSAFALSPACAAPAAALFAAAPQLAPAPRERDLLALLSR